MKTKIVIVALLLIFNIVLATKKVNKIVYFPTPKTEVNISKELFRLDKLMDNIEKSVQYKAK